MSGKFRSWFYGHSNLHSEDPSHPPVQASRKPLVRINPLIHQLAAEEYNRQGYDQSAERLAERGGFSEHEVIMLLADALLRERGYTTEDERYTKNDRLMVRMHLRSPA